ncbi:MAG: hypothetical protein ACI9HY_003238 [Planctomycetaceae bacterium]|jgi:hypothetical protein
MIDEPIRKSEEKSVLAYISGTSRTEAYIVGKPIYAKWDPLLLKKKG